MSAVEGQGWGSPDPPRCCPPTPTPCPPTRLGRLRGLDPPPALRAGRARVPLPALPHVPGPGGAAGGARSLPALLGPAAAPPPASAARTSWATRRGRWTSARARRSRRQTGARPAGPVRLLAGLRYFGHSFNPVSLYYCFDPAGERVEAVVADVQNIPWGERHPYVLARGERARYGPRRRAREDLPRLPADGHGPDLRLPRRRTGRAPRRPHRVAPARVRGPDSRALADSRAPKTFDATLSLRRRELSRRTLTGLLARYPAMSLQVVAKIYAQSLRLKLKGARYYPHPEGSRPKGFVSP